MFTPFAHANDDVLLLPVLAVAWGRNGEDGARILPILALWTLSALPLAFLLPRPWDVLGVLPVVLVFVACGTVGRKWIPLRRPSANASRPPSHEHALAVRPHRLG